MKDLRGKTRRKAQGPDETSKDDINLDTEKPQKAEGVSENIQQTE